MNLLSSVMSLKRALECANTELTNKASIILNLTGWPSMAHQASIELINKPEVTLIRVRESFYFIFSMHSNGTIYNSPILTIE